MYFISETKWIHDPRQRNIQSPNNIRRDASRHFRNKQKVKLKDKIKEIETNSKFNLYKGINNFKNGYQLISLLIMKENVEYLVKASKESGL